MKAKISKSQLEVWEWKENAYNEIKDMPKDKRIDYIIKNTEKIINELGLKMESPTFYNKVYKA